MRLIKRYPNRKLYDTAAKQYITLDGIADLIRQGEEVQVTDHVSGEDLTAVTLTQIIFEQEKKQTGLIPNTLLSGLIRAGGDPVNFLQRTLASSLGLWRQIDEEIKMRVQSLVKQGELSEGEGQTMLAKLLSQGVHLGEGFHKEIETIERVIGDRQLPRQADIQHLADQIDQLSSQIQELQSAHTPDAATAVSADPDQPSPSA